MANQLTMADINYIKSLAAAGWSRRKIARETGYDRGTIRKYLDPEPPPKMDGSQADPDPCPDPGSPSLEPNPDSKPSTVIAGNQALETSVCTPFRATIEALLEKNLTADRIHRELCEDHGFTHSYPSVVRYVRKLKVTQPKRVWRMECEPGEEAQVDFGVARTLRTPEGKLRYSNVLRVTLSHSRKAYTETVPFQNTECFIRALENAFRHFGGTPATLRIDNLKAAVQKADWYDPQLNPKLMAFASHYGTAIIPTRPYTPQHKGKVESDVGYVKRSALKGHEFNSIEEQNAHLKNWESNIADKRIHGTTRKQIIIHFETNEKAALRPLPPDLFPAYQEEQRTVHRDSYIGVKKAYYEVPPEYIGRSVWVRWDSKMVHILDEKMVQIAVHLRLEAGKFSACLGARGQRRGRASATSPYWTNRAAILGGFVEKWALAMSSNRPDHSIRVLQGLIALEEKHQSIHIDKACEVALASGEYTLGDIKRHLIQLEKYPGTILKQEEFPFLEEHPIIRPLSQYQDLLDTENN